MQLDVTQWPINAVRDVAGGGDAIQDAIDAFLANPGMWSAIYLPPGTYRTTKPLIAALAGRFMHFAMTSRANTLGATSYFDVSTVIQFDGDGAGSQRSLPVFILQGGRACHFEGIVFHNTGNYATIEGIASEGPVSGVSGIFSNKDLTDWHHASIRTNRYSPHAAFVIDPFHTKVPHPDRYPGLDSYYGGDSLVDPRGSSKTSFDYCGFLGGYVGLANSPPGDQCAVVVATNAGPYSLTAGLNIKLKVDGGGEQTFTIQAGDVVSSMVTADALAARINATISGAFVDVVGGKPRIAGDTRGAGGAIEVTGGTANGVVGFSTSVVNGIATLQLQNNDLNTYYGCQWLYNTFHYVSGQSQERSNSIINSLFNGAWCAVATDLFGVGGSAAGNCPSMWNCQFLCTRYAFAINALTPVLLENLYIEGVASLGKFGLGYHGLIGNAKIVNLTGGLYMAHTYAPAEPELPFQWMTWGMTEFDHMHLATGINYTGLFRPWEAGHTIYRAVAFTSVLPDSQIHHVPFAHADSGGVPHIEYAQTYSPYHPANGYQVGSPSFEVQAIGGGNVQVVEGADPSLGAVSLASTAGLQIGDVVRLTASSPTSYIPQVITPDEYPYNLVGPIGVISDIVLDTSITIDHLPYGFPFFEGGGSPSNYVQLEAVRWINWEIGATTVPSLRIYLDAFEGLEDSGGDFPTDGEAIAAWRGAGGTSIDFTQGTAGKRPLYDADITALNHLPGVVPDNSDDILVHGTKANTNFLHKSGGATIVIGLHYLTAGAGVLFTTLQATNMRVGIEVNLGGGGELSVTIGNGSGTFVHSYNSASAGDTMMTNNSYNVITIRHQAPHSPQFEVRLNGHVLQSESFSGGVPDSGDSFATMSLFDYATGMGACGGGLQTLVAVEGWLADAVVTAIEGRLWNRAGGVWPPP